MQQGKTPKVSVCVITYNHEKFIRQCLQSIMDQETDFDFEVIVGDDCSTDGTREIVQEFAAKYSSVLRTLFQKKNTGGTKNYLDVHASAIGEYIAVMDGDDYLLAEKLKKQADFLDRYKNCSFVCHRVRCINEKGLTVRFSPEGSHPKFTNIEELIRKYSFFTHSSKMYRRSSSVFEHPHNHDIIDFFFHVEHASRGQIGFIPDTLGCYRRNTNGISKQTGERLYHLFDLTLKGYDRARQLGVEEEVVHYGKSRYLVGAAVCCLSHNDFDGYRRFIATSRINGRYLSFSHQIFFMMRKQVHLIRILLRLRQWLIKYLRVIRSTRSSPISETSNISEKK